MVRTITALISFMVFALLAGCTTGEIKALGNDRPQVIETPAETEEIAEPPAIIDEEKETVEEEKSRGPVEYSITIGDDYIALRDWEDTVDIYGLLGEPASQEVEVLGQGADTFAGSYIKTLKYENLEIKLFSPHDNGQSFWVMEINVTGGDYTTYGGIGIGDSLEELIVIYPTISKVEDGRTDEDNSAYEISDMESYNYLRFEVTESAVSQIRLYHMMP